MTCLLDLCSWEFCLFGFSAALYGSSFPPGKRKNKIKLPKSNKNEREVLTLCVKIMKKELNFFTYYLIIFDLLSENDHLLS